MLNTVNEFRAKQMRDYAEGKPSVNEVQIMYDILREFPQKREDIEKLFREKLKGTPYEISHELAGKLVNIALSVLKNQGKADNPETGFWHKID